MFPVPEVAGAVALLVVALHDKVVPLTLLGLLTVIVVLVPEHNATVPGETFAVGVVLTVAITGRVPIDSQPVEEL